MPSFDTQTLGLQESLNFLRSNKLPAEAMKVAKKGLHAALAIIAAGIRRQVPPVKTDGHSSESIKKSIGKSVKQIGVGKELIGRVGVGVGKRRGTYRTTGVFLAVGTVDRYSGIKTVRKAVKRRWQIVNVVDSGKPIRFRGRVQKDPFVTRGFEATRVAARQKFEDVVYRDLNESVRAMLMTIQ